MIYLASPYSHPDPLIMKTRFLLAEQATAELLMSGEIVFSPIVHCHEMAMRYNMPTDFNFWSKYCCSMLRKADILYILAIPGWDTSIGVSAEHRLAKEMFMPVFFVNEHGRYI